MPISQPSPPSTAPTTDAASVERELELLAAAEVRITPVRVSIPYQLGLIVVAGAMLLLPLVYATLIGALAFGVWWYALHSPAMLFSGGSGGIWPAVMYVAPIFGGAVGVLFMVKPILARPPQPQPPIRLSPEEEPLLHGFVERMCTALGSPAPREIQVDMQVNASASFRRGVRSMLSSDLVLTLGLPLVAGLNVTQLSGILAHEFGHFTQTAAMRFSYLIGSVNRWFVRVVFERDQWDQKLDTAREEHRNSYVQVVLHAAVFSVWLSRRILWLLMYVGHAMSAYLSRQMEYNADRYQVQVVGSGGLRSTYLRVHLLNFAQQAAVEQVNALAAEQRLPDNLAALTRLHAERLDAREGVRAQIGDAALGGRTGPFDTHPSGGDRVRAAERLAAAPGMARPEPARDLFRDFDQLAIRASTALYQSQLGDRVTSYATVAIDDAATELAAADQSAEAGRRVFYGGAVLSFGVAPWPVAPVPPATVNAGIAAVQAARERAEALREVVEPSVRHCDELHDKARRLADALLLDRAGIRFAPDALGVPTSDADELRRLEQVTEQERRQALEALTPIHATIQERVAVAASLASHLSFADPAAGFQARLAACRAVAETLQALERNWEDIRELIRYTPQLAMLVGQAEAHGDEEDFQKAATRLIKDARDVLELLVERLGETTYPFASAEGSLSVARYLLPGDVHRDIQVVHDAAGFLERGTVLYRRCWAELGALVEAVEAAVGLPQLDLEVHEPTR